MWPRDLLSVHAGVLVSDLIGGLLIVGYALAAVVALVRGRSLTQARLLVAEGAVFGLSFKVAGTLLKTVELHTWEQIGLLATVLVLRTILKQLFVWEKRQLQRRDAAPNR